MLIDVGADLNFAIHCNRTSVITAAEKNNITTLTMLVSAGAPPVPKDQYDRIPLDFISKEKQPDAYRYLTQFMSQEQ